MKLIKKLTAGAVVYALCIMPFALSANDFFAYRTVHLTPVPGECVGQANDILCVFDTVVACAVRDNARLCESVGMEFTREFRNSMGEIIGANYRFRPIEMFISRGTSPCEVPNGTSCFLNTTTGELTIADAMIRDNNNVVVYLRRMGGGNWQAIYAARFSCWSDEECS